MSDMSSVVDASLEIVIVFLLAFCMKAIGLFNQETAQKVLDVVVNFLVPMCLMKNVPAVQLNLTWLVLPAAAIVYAVLTLPVIRLIFLRAFPALPRADRGQLLLCCTGHAVTLVGYPVVAGFYGNSSLALCACWDLGGIFVAYLATYVVAALYAPSSDLAGQRCVTEAGQADAAESGNASRSNEDLPVEASGRRRSVTFSELRRSATFDSLADLGSHLDGEARRSSVSLPRELAGVSLHSQEAPPGHGAAADSASTAGTAQPPPPEVELMSCTGEAAETKEQGCTPQLDSRRSSAASLESRVASGFGRLLAGIVWKVMKKPVTLGFLVGVAMRALRIEVDALPVVVQHVITKSAGCTATITIFGLGLFFQPGLLLERKYLRRLAVLLLVKYGFGLACGIAMYLAMRSVDVLVPSVLSIALVMPTPPVVIAYAAEYGYDRDFAALVVNASLLVSFVLSFGLALLLPLLAPEAAAGGVAVATM